MKKLPDPSAIPTPDLEFGDLASDISDLVGNAADAISSAAGHVPGLDDYRRLARRRRLMTIGGVAALVVAIVIVLKLRSRDDTPTQH